MTVRTTSAVPGRLLVRAVSKQTHVEVHIAGEADLSTAPLLRRRLVDSLRHGRPSLVVDAGALSFCDLSGLDALCDALQTVERSGTHVTLQPSTQLAWLIATVAQLPPTSGQPGPDPAGRPLPPRPRPSS